MRTLVPGLSGREGEARRGGEVATNTTTCSAAPARVIAGRAAGLDLFALDAPHLFDRPGNPYLGPDNMDWPDNARRFAALARVGADIGLGAIAAFQPQVVHAHDWQAGLAAAYLRYSEQRGPGSLITIHNLAFQGHFPVSVFWELGLPDEALSVDGVEYYGGVGFLKAGLLFSDVVTTVSPTYAREIQTPEFGMGLDGLLRSRGGAVHGIVNGVDDSGLESGDRLGAGRSPTTRCASTCARATRRRCRPGSGSTRSVDRPLFAVVSRLSHQKGLDLLLHALPRHHRPGRPARPARLRRARGSNRASATPRPGDPARSAASSTTTRSSRICSSPAPTSSWCRRASSLAGSRSSARCATARRRSSRGSEGSPIR